MKVALAPSVPFTEELSELLTRLVKQIPYEYRRQAMGDVVQTLLEGKSRKAEDVLGWNRYTVELGINELRTGIRCISDVSARGKNKVEEDNPQLLRDIERLLEPRNEPYSHLRTTLLHNDVTGAKAVRNALIENGYSEDELPAERTFYELLNRPGYRRRTVAKSKVQKNEMTDAIFANLRQLNSEADADPNTLRISVDTKATVNLSEYSRGGKSRGLEAVKALDHDMASHEKLIPGGILEPVSGQSFLFFGDSHKTSDFMADGLDAW